MPSRLDRGLCLHPVGDPHAYFERLNFRRLQDVPIILLDFQCRISPDGDLGAFWSSTDAKTASLYWITMSSTGTDAQSQGFASPAYMIPTV